MNISEEDRKRLVSLLETIDKELQVDRGELQRELSKLLAGADRDVYRVKDSTTTDMGELKTLSDRMRDLVVKFESERPRLSRVAHEIVDHLTHMGI